LEAPPVMGAGLAVGAGTEEVELETGIFQTPPPEVIVVQAVVFGGTAIWYKVPSDVIVVQLIDGAEYDGSVGGR